ncbi:MAG TPA: TonB family protein [Cytophagaceae bacterium]|jgi:protein TonB
MINRSESELLLDRIIFSNRNRSYGAFDLRNEYNSRLKTAIILAFFIFTSALVVPQIFDLNKKDYVDEGDLTSTPIDLGDFELPTTKIFPAAAPKEDLPKVDTKRFGTPVIKDDNLVAVEGPIPTKDDFENSNPGSEDSDGKEGVSTALPAKGIEETEIENTKKIEGWASIDAKFKSGEFAKFIQKNLNYPAKAADLGVDGRVFVQFIIEKDGTISDVKVTKGIGYGCDEEAIRVIQLTNGMWNAGNNNGVPVRLRKILPITFRLTQ